MSNTQAGQPSERTPDFIPGWFEARPGNPDPVTREAVRVFDDGSFPIGFLRSTERVSPCGLRRRGFIIGPTSQSGHNRFDLAVPPGYWIVRYGDGHLHIWRDKNFKEKYIRELRTWSPAVERIRDNPHLTDEQRAKFARQLYTDAWKGTEPAKGTRRALILESVKRWLLDNPGKPLTSEAEALDFADAIEAALPRSTIVHAGREADAQEALDPIDADDLTRRAKRLD